MVDATDKVTLVDVLPDTNARGSFQVVFTGLMQDGVVVSFTTDSETLEYEKDGDNIDGQGTGNDDDVFTGHTDDTKTWVFSMNFIDNFDDNQIFRDRYIEFWL